MHVVVTAGHVDHGKSTLVRALTGQDPDRLDEEKRRGLSIRLGYCWTTLPRAGEVAFVDVPGHERFVSTALSGMGPVPVALFVVAADDPWMPQAAEHLAALDALDVRHGLLVVTRSDLADPAPALALAQREIARTSLREALSVAVSGRTGDGLDTLVQALETLLDRLPTPDAAAPVRLWVDRSFHVRGSGTVVTGTLPAGTIAAGDRLVHPEGEVRVRRLQSLGRDRDVVRGTARVALELGSGGTAARPGDALVTADAFEPTTVVDVLVRGSGNLPRSPLLHVGAASTQVHVRPLGPEHARLLLPHPLPLLVGDHAVVRDPGSRALWGVEVLDPSPPPLRRRGAATARGRDLTTYDGSLASEVERRGQVQRPFAHRIGVHDTTLPVGTIEVGDWLISTDRGQQLASRLSELVAASTDPLGPTLESMARLLDVEPSVAAAVVPSSLRVVEGRLRRAGPEELPSALRPARDALVTRLDADPLSAPDAQWLRDLGLDVGALALLHRRGDLLRVDDWVVVGRDADQVAARTLSALPEPFTTSQARTAMGTTRRAALALLKHLDRQGVTVRLADDTRRMRRR